MCTSFFWVIRCQFVDLFKCEKRHKLHVSICIFNLLIFVAIILYTFACHFEYRVNWHAKTWLPITKINDVHILLYTCAPYCMYISFWKVICFKAFFVPNFIIAKWLARQSHNYSIHFTDVSKINYFIVKADLNDLFYILIELNFYYYFSLFVINLLMAV